MFGTTSHSDHYSDCKSCQIRQAKKRREKKIFLTLVLQKHIGGILVETVDSLLMPLAITNGGQAYSHSLREVWFSF